MRKSIKFLIMSLILCVMSIFIGGQKQVYAADLSSTGVINVSETITENITLADINRDSAIVISSGASVVLRDITININNASVDQLFEVQGGCSLELDNVVIASSSNIDIAIKNSGIVKISDVSWGESFTTTISNVHTAENLVADSIQLYNVSDDMNISLGAGYVSVYENTDMTGVVTIDLGTTAYSDDLIGQVLVKGRNTLANFYESNFRLKNTPNIADYMTALEYLTYLQDNQPYYMDYVGDIGDSLAVADDGYAIKADEKFTYNIESGDLIFTKFNGGIKPSGSDDRIYAYGQYATTGKFLDITSNAYKINSSVIQNLASATSGEVVLNNYTSIKSTTAISSSATPVSNVIDIVIKVYIGSNLQDDMCQNVRLVSTGSRTFFVDTKGYEYQSMSCTSAYVTIDKSMRNGKFVRPKISCTNDANDCEITINLKSKEVSRLVEVELTNSSTVYSKSDKMSLVAPYYILDSNKIELEDSEYKVYDSNDVLCTEIIDAGTYKVVLTSKSDLIVFKVTELAFVIEPKTISLVYTNSFVYDGFPKSVTYEIVGVESGDTVDVLLKDNVQTNAGSYNVGATILNSNYKLDTSSKTTTLFIDKATIDVSHLSMSDKVVTYNGDPQTISVTGDTTGFNIVYKHYKAESSALVASAVNAGEYRVEAVIKVADMLESNYYPIENFTATLIVNKVVIDTSMVSFTDVYHQYDGKPFVYTVSGTLPAEVSSVLYDNNEHTNCSDEPYIAVANFRLKSQYRDNYVALPLTAKIYITKAVVDFSNFRYGDKTIQYDGQTHQIFVSGIDTSVLKIDYANVEGTDVGSYAQNVMIALQDTDNYEPIPSDKTNLSATLTIVPAVIDMSGISFNNKTVDYSPGVKHTIEITGTISKLVTTYKYYYDGDLIDDYPMDSGEYDVFAHFIIEGWDARNYEPIQTKKAKLTINAIEIDFKYAYIESKTFQYDGNVHNLSLINCPANVTYTYSNNSKIDVGVYTVTVNIDYDERNYYLVNYSGLSAVLTITRSPISMSGVKFEDKSFVYDKTLKTITIEGELPEFVRIVEYKNNSRINAGSNVAQVFFEVTNANYSVIDSMSCNLVIAPKTVTIALKKDSFEYTGSPVTVELEVSGIIDGDEFDYSISNNSNTLASTYYAVVTNNSTNYKIEGTTSLRYEIKRAVIDMKGVSFGNIEVVYDGKPHNIQLQGELPQGINYKIVGGDAVAAGVYDVCCEFILVDQNYIKPDNLEATITITPRPILIEFSKYTGLIADGTEKSIGVKFIGLADEVFNDYKIEYSKTPIEAGTYVCQVTVNSPNYQVIGKSAISFEILTNTKTYVDQVYDIIVEGSHFNADTQVTVANTETEDIKNSLESYDYKQYKAFKIVSDDQERQEIQISLALKDFAVENVEYLKLYRVQSGKLIEVKYSRENGRLNFVGSTFDEFVILEESNQVDKNTIWIYTSIALAVVSIMMIISIAIVYIMSKKKIK